MWNRFSEDLRNERNQIWNRLAAAAKCNSASPLEICFSWSEAANIILAKAFIQCFGEFLDLDVEDLESAKNHEKKIALFAFGKLGAMELNLSSDVDLLLVAEETSEDLLVSLRKFQKLLNDRTHLGYVFRLDFDLRPGGKQGPLIPSLEQLRDYYGNYGETWERLAFVRLRPICGDQNIINDVMGFSKKFSYRRHLDFTLFEDLKNLRAKIQDHYWARSQANIIDLKLGVGGIRDVELFAHALQVVHGGKDQGLQLRSTSEALFQLQQKNLLPLEEAAFLEKHYWNLRMLENFVQAQDDQQTHLIKIDETYPDFISDSLRNITTDMKQCDQIVRTLLGESPIEQSLDNIIENELTDIGMDQQEIEELWQEILSQEVLSHHRTRDESARKAFLNEFMIFLKEQGGDRHRGLLFLRDFVRGTRAKATFFSMLLREKALMKKLAWLFGHSAYLSKILCNRPELLDSFIYRSQHDHSADMGQLLEELAEKKLLSELISGSQFLEDKNLHELMRNLTDTADSIASILLAAIKKDFPSSIEILALGKWGGQELGFRSDLDFIFVITGEPVENDYKVAKRFISRITESHRGGNIFSVDMRLSPSGMAGPLVIPLHDLQDYLASEAQAWERQAYLKGRWIGYSGPNLKLSFLSRGLKNTELQELDRIRLELISKSNFPNLKLSEGGLIDIEFAAQTFLLNSRNEIFQRTETESFISEWGDSALQLMHNYVRLRQIEQMFQLVASENTVELNRNHQSFQALGLVLGQDSESLVKEVELNLSNNIEILKSLDPRRQSN